MDVIQPFMLEDGFCRGCLIAADTAVREIWAKHKYPACLKPLIQEAIILALALSANIKYQGVFALQVKGDGPVKVLYADVTQDKHVRAYCVFDAGHIPESGTVTDYFGSANLLFSVAQKGQEPYQGIVKITSASLTEAVLDYFKFSEQIQTDLVLMSDIDKTRCLFLQKMPTASNKTPDQEADIWETVCVLMHSVQPDELLSDTLSETEILRRLFHANKPVVFPTQKPVFQCRCSRDKMKSFLTQMNPSDRLQLFQDNAIETVCEFCGETFTFTQEDFK